MRSTLRHAALSTLVALGATATAIPAAWAQDDHRAQRPPAGDMHAKMQAMREAHERQHAQDMRTILRLRPDQEPALTAFLQSHKPPANRPEHRPPSADAAPLTTTQRLDEMTRREAERTAMRQRRSEALRTFYGALTPEQRQVFDAMQRMQHGGHEHGGWGRHGFGGPGRGPAGGPPARD